MCGRLRKSSNYSTRPCTTLWGRASLLVKTLMVIEHFLTRLTVNYRSRLAVWESHAFVWNFGLSQPLLWQHGQTVAHSKRKWSATCFYGHDNKGHNSGTRG